MHINSHIRTHARTRTQRTNTTSPPSLTSKNNVKFWESQERQQFQIINNATIVYAVRGLEYIGMLEETKLKRPIPYSSFPALLPFPPLLPSLPLVLDSVQWDGYAKANTKPA